MNKMEIIIVVLSFFPYIFIISMQSIVLYLTINEKIQFKCVYLCSKLLTIKNIVASNHNLKIINDFSPSGKPIGLNVGYKILLKLINNNGCQEDYRPCGKLDTIGNILCIDNFLDCPINKMKVDSNKKAELYYSNYSSTTLSNISTNYSFFYSNDFINEKVKVSIIKTEKVEPKYVTLENFIIDYETYKYRFVDLKKIEESSTLFGNNNYQSDDIIRIIELYLEKFNDIEFELISLGAKGLMYFINVLSQENKKKYINQFERFTQYLEKRIDEDEEKSIDEYFTHIGDYFYAETYIGFKSIKDLDTFMKFDRTILSKAFFPNFNYILPALILSSLFFVSAILFFLSSIEKDNIYWVFISFNYFVCTPIALGFLIYSAIMYKKIHNNKKLEEFKSIQSDDFINDFIKEFIKECKYYEEKIIIIMSLCIVAFVFLIIISIIKLHIYRINN